VRRLLVICAATLAVVAAFVLARKHVRVAHAANPSNLALANAPAAMGCTLGPSYTFCDQLPGTSSATAQFRVQNTSAVSNVMVSAPAAIPGLGANFAAGDFAVTSTTCSGNLTAGQGCNVNVLFSPTAVGLRAAAVTVTDAGGDKLAINLTGTSGNLTLATSGASPCAPNNAFTYCVQAVGSASGAQTFTLTAGASGAMGVNIALAAIPGLESEFASADFTTLNDTCTGAALAPNASCTVGVVFRPTVAGTRSAVLVATDAAKEVSRLLLAGPATPGGAASGLQFTGASAGSTFPCAAVNAFGYCNEPDGGTSEANTYTITNTAGAMITGLVIPKGSTTPNSNVPPDFTVQNTTCSATLAANASCNINVQFAPQATGPRQGVISVTDDQGDVAGLNLAGFGDDYNLGLASGQLEEVGVAAGGTATFQLQVNPDSVFGMNGEHVTFVCPDNLPHNTSCTITPCPASVTAATAAPFQVVLVTSNLITAPKPPAGTGCASYSVAQILAPGLRGPEWQLPAPLVATSALAAILLALALVWAFVGAQSRGSKRLRLGLVATGVVFAAVAGCGGKQQLVLPTTPAGSTNMDVIGQALDANGNPINAARSVQIILSVTNP